MTIWYARGRRGEPPHFSQNKAIAARDIAADEVMFPIDGLPPGNCKIADDGASLVELEASLQAQWREIRAQRNILLDRWRWTVVADSPLSTECQTSWLTYLKALNRVTVDHSEPGGVIWPVEPSIDYAF